MTTGGCLCGAVRFEARGEPKALALCHCRSCRLAAGAQSVAWAVFARENFAFTQGTPVLFESSPGVRRSFCGRCGTSLTYEHVKRTAFIDVTTGSLDRPDDFAPTKEIWTEDRIAWEPMNEAIPHFAQSSG